MLQPSWDARRVVCDGFLPALPFPGPVACYAASATLSLVLSSYSLQYGHDHVGLIAHMLLNRRSSLNLRLTVD